MKNLAGNADCDEWIKDELMRARIPAESISRGRTEVPYQLIGRLGPIEFRRAWTYWIARGPVPIDVARSLYADPVGRTDVRVDGHCGCPEPKDREFVTVYHIDSEIGLRLFADMMTEVVRAQGAPTPGA